MDRDVLRQLAWMYYSYARDDRMAKNKRLHMAVNDLEMLRPVVLLDTIPWHEFDCPDDALTLQCDDPFLREVEWFLRTTIYQYKNMPGDMIIPPYLPVKKIITNSGIGVDIHEDTLKTDERNDIVSQKYFDQFETAADLERIRFPTISYNEVETIRRYEMLGELVGDIIPVKLQGRSYFGVTIWDEIAQYRGATNLLVDLYDRPDFSHKLVSILTDIALSRLEQFEALDLFDNEPAELHCTPALTKALPSAGYNGANKVTRKDVWGRGAAQIFASVSREMHDEFDIEYMKRTIGQCGLVYYGCCEPLDKKIDIVAKIPNLRKISISPWADVEASAEAINTQFVLSVKPHPSSVAVAQLDEDALRKEIGKIIGACKKHKCACDIVLKDISTCGHNPTNLIRWEQIVMDMVMG